MSLDARSQLLIENLCNLVSKGKVDYEIMRLWHQDLLPLLPRSQILGQHRECCALRGMGWGRKHSTVDYVFTYNVKRLVDYHYLVLKEMERRGYEPDRLWYCPEYRGKKAMPWPSDWLCDQESTADSHIYLEHDDAYRDECVDNLTKKGVKLYGYNFFDGIE